MSAYTRRRRRRRRRLRRLRERVFRRARRAPQFKSVARRRRRRRPAAPGERTQFIVGRALMCLPYTVITCVLIAYIYILVCPPSFIPL